MRIAPEILISLFFSQESLLAPGTQLKAGPSDGFEVILLA
jgi:hypothetical protein